jgi:hypothetical protein
MPDITGGGPPPPTGTTLITIGEATIRAILLQWLHCNVAGGPWTITTVSAEEIEVEFEPAAKPA